MRPYASSACGLKLGVYETLSVICPSSAPALLQQSIYYAQAHTYFFKSFNPNAETHTHIHTHTHSLTKRSYGIRWLRWNLDTHTLLPPLLRKMAWAVMMSRQRFFIFGGKNFAFLFLWIYSVLGAVRVDP
jgi:hypothetical protein